MPYICWPIVLGHVALNSRMGLKACVNIYFKDWNKRSESFSTIPSELWILCCRAPSEVHAVRSLGFNYVIFF